MRHGKVELISEGGGGYLRANWVTVVGVPGGDDAPTLGALVVGLVAVVVSMMSAVTPPTGLPEGTLILWMIGFVLIALEAIGKSWFTSLPLTQDLPHGWLFIDVGEDRLNVECGSETEVKSVVRVRRSLTRMDRGDTAGVQGVANRRG